MKNLLVLFAFVLTTLIANSTWAADVAKCSDEKSYPEVSLKELQAIVKSNPAPTIFDVNSEESYAKRHIGKALHYGTVKDDFRAKLPTSTDSLIIAYCGGPSCKAWMKAASRACELGYTNVKHFKGGISGWKE